MMSETNNTFYEYECHNPECIDPYIEIFYANNYAHPTCPNCDSNEFTAQTGKTIKKEDAK